VEAHPRAVKGRNGAMEAHPRDLAADSVILEPWSVNIYIKVICRIQIKVKGRSQSRILIKVKGTSSIQIHITSKVKGRIRIQIKVMRIRNTVRISQFYHKCPPLMMLKNGQINLIYYTSRYRAANASLETGGAMRAGVSVS
jgi:hypothetical protein